MQDSIILLCSHSSFHFPHDDSFSHIESTLLLNASFDLYVPSLFLPVPQPSSSLLFFILDGVGAIDFKQRYLEIVSYLLKPSPRSLSVSLHLCLCLSLSVSLPPPPPPLSLSLSARPYLCLHVALSA